MQPPYLKLIADKASKQPCLPGMQATEVQLSVHGSRRTPSEDGSLSDAGHCLGGSRDHPRTRIQITCTHTAHFEHLGSPAHADLDHIYAQTSPRSHVHTSEIICTQILDHMYTQMSPRPHVNTSEIICARRFGDMRGGLHSTSLFTLPTCALL